MAFRFYRDAAINPLVWRTAIGRPVTLKSTSNYFQYANFRCYPVRKEKKLMVNQLSFILNKTNLLKRCVLMAKIYRKLAVILAGGVLGLGSVIHAIPAIAVTTFTTDTSAFLNSNLIVSTETFDSYLGDSAGPFVTIDSITYTGTKTPYWRVVERNSHIYSDNSVLFGGDYSEPMNVLTFGENELVNAIGFNIIPSGFKTGELFFEFDFIVEEADGTLATFSSRPLPGSKNFFGFSSEVGIKKLTVLQPSGKRNWTNWAYDDVSRSAVSAIQ